MVVCSASVLLPVSFFALAQRPELVVQTTHTGWIQSVAFSNDGKTLATGGGDGNIKLWHTDTGKLIRTIEGHPGITLEPYEEEKNGKKEELPSLAGIKELLVYLVEQLNGRAKVVHSVTFSPDDSTLASGSGAKTIKLWDPNTGVLRHIFTQPVRVWLVALNRDGTKLLSIGEDDSYRYWDVVNTSQITEDLPPLTSFQLPWRSVNKQLTARYDEKLTTITLMNLTTGDETLLEGHSKGVRRAVFSPTGEVLASCSWNNTIRLWDLSGKSPTRILEGHAATIASLAFSPDGEILASVGGDLIIKLWTVASGKEVRTFHGHVDHVKPLAFGGDDSLLVTAIGKSIHTWNMKKGQLSGSAVTDQGSVSLGVFSPDKKIFATANTGLIDLNVLAKSDWRLKIIHQPRTLDAFLGPTGNFDLYLFNSRSGNNGSYAGKITI